LIIKIYKLILTHNK